MVSLFRRQLSTRRVKLSRLPGRIDVLPRLRLTDCRVLIH